MVVKPLEFIAKSRRGLVQPAVKCRGREYLHIVQSSTLRGIPIYTKGKFVVEGSRETYYVLVSSKRAV